MSSLLEVRPIINPFKTVYGKVLALRHVLMSMKWESTIITYDLMNVANPYELHLE